jgi:hypothetical protein
MVHTLAHVRYRALARNYSKGSPGYDTLVEGVCCVLAETVWRRVVAKAKDPGVRADVEGCYADEEFLEPNDMSDDRYDSYDEAVKLLDIVGIGNLVSAFRYCHTGYLGGSAGPDALLEMNAQFAEVVAAIEHDLPPWRLARAEAAPLLSRVDNLANDETELIRRDLVWLAGRFDTAEAAVRCRRDVDRDAPVDFTTVADALTAAFWLAAHGPELPTATAALRRELDKDPFVNFSGSNDVASLGAVGEAARYG